MKIRNREVASNLSPHLRETLFQMRAMRGFDAEKYIDAKVSLLADYFASCGLQSAVIAVSGGIDSAVVLGLLARVRSLKESPLKNIIAVTLPVNGTDGVTGQDAATSRAIEVAEKFGIRIDTIDLEVPHRKLIDAVFDGVGVQGDDWAEGQVASYIRTPALYYITSLLSMKGKPGVIVGTTNRDEGGYIGFFGKTADGAVDLQPISDLHKSEVYAVARALGVPDSIIDIAPTGDMFDAKTDEEVFGFSYDFLELYQSILCMSGVKEARLTAAWDDAARKEFEAMAENVEAMHRYNAHKYLGASPAVHLDILKASVPGGWNNTPALPRLVPDCDRSAWPAETFTLRFGQLGRDTHVPMPIKKALPAVDESIVEVPELLSQDEVDRILNAAYPLAGWVKVGLDGIRSNYEEGDAVGSQRAWMHSLDLANRLWSRLKSGFPDFEVFDETSANDDGQHPLWRPIGINPFFRLIAYPKGGFLVPHYDAPFGMGNGVQTMKSLVVYLMAEGDGGATRFIKDKQAGVPVVERDLSDWSRPANLCEIAGSLRPKVGTGAYWNHRILHDGEEVRSEMPKILLRTDIVYARLNWYR